MAGFYGQQSTTIIERLAGISDGLAKLLTAGHSQPQPVVVASDGEESTTPPPEKDSIVISDSVERRQKNQYGIEYYDDRLKLIRIRIVASIHYEQQ